MAILTEADLKAPNPRLVAFDNMLQHLGIDPGPQNADLFLLELRAALECCAVCPIVDQCHQWITHGYVGTPPSCDGRKAFRKLMFALSSKATALSQRDEDIEESKCDKSNVVVFISDYGKFTKKDPF